jgi:hypothetical protein
MSIMMIGVLMPFILPAQTKFEREYRINENEVPEKAIQFIRKAFLDKKIKWYAEESQDGKSIEAKAKYRKHKFSVEFDTSGNLQDVEKTVKFKTLSPQLTDAISQSLTNEFGKYKIMKVQVQWTADNPGTLKELIKNGTSSNAYNEKYEVIVESRADKTYKAFEVLMDRTGTIEKSLELDLRGMNNMEF